MVLKYSLRLGVFFTDDSTSDTEGNILHVARLLDT